MYHSGFEFPLGRNIRNSWHGEYGRLSKCLNSTINQLKRKIKIKETFRDKHTFLFLELDLVRLIGSIF